MKKYELPLWLPLVFLFTVGFVGFVIPSWTDAIVHLGKLAGINESWAGFAGAIIGAVAVLVTGATALIGAAIAVRPVYAQLREMSRQRDFATLGILRKRAEDMNSDAVLFARVIKAANGVLRILNLVIESPSEERYDELNKAVNQLEQAVDDVHARAGHVWGTEAIQKSRTIFETAASLLAYSIVQLNRSAPSKRIELLKEGRLKWIQECLEVVNKGLPLIKAIQDNRAITARLVAKIEQRIITED